MMLLIWLQQWSGAYQKSLGVPNQVKGHTEIATIRVQMHWFRVPVKSNKKLDIKIMNTQVLPYKVAMMQTAKKKETFFSEKLFTVLRRKMSPFSFKGPNGSNRKRLVFREEGFG